MKTQADTLTFTRVGGVSSLSHEARYNAMKDAAVVVALTKAAGC